MVMDNGESEPLEGQPEFEYYSEVLMHDVYDYAHKTLNLHGNDVSVAIVDTGIAYQTNPFLTKALLSPPEGSKQGMNFTEETEAVGSHGTTVAVLVNAIAPKAKLIDVKAVNAYGGTDRSNLLVAMHELIQMREKHRIPDIVNLSIGTTSFPCEGKDDLANIVNQAADAGILVVTSAGNYGKNGPLACPGCAAGSLTVGGVVDEKDDNGNQTVRLYEQSSWSKITGKPDLVAPARVPARTRILFKLTPVGPEITLDEPMFGTSYAAPFVTGIAALLYEKLKKSKRDPSANLPLVRSRFTSTADAGVLTAPKNAQGAGIISVRGVLGGPI